MSNYSQLTSFTPKDSLPSGNPAKVIKGSDFDGEFNAISVAIATKAEASDISTLTANKVQGPASATDNAITRFDGTTGKLIQDSAWTIEDDAGLRTRQNNGLGNFTNYTVKLDSFRVTHEATLTGFSFFNGYYWSSSGTDLMVLSPFGNLSIGPSTGLGDWDSSVNAFQVGAAASVYASSLSAGLACGVFYDGSWKHKATGDKVATYQQFRGEHAWRSSVSGAPGSVVSWTQTMTLTDTGRLGVGPSSPQVKLHVVSDNPGTPETTGSGTTGVVARFQNSSVNFDLGVYGSGNCFIQPRLSGDNATNFSLVLNPNGGQVLVGKDAFGYGTGAGGTVTQVTSKGTPVTLNKPSGKITTDASALSAGASVYFLFSNSFIAATDALALSVFGGGAAQDRYAVSAGVFSGGAYVSIRNTTGGSLSEPIDINFSVIKGATA